MTLWQSQIWFDFDCWPSDLIQNQFWLNKEKKEALFIVFCSSLLFAKPSIRVLNLLKYNMRHNWTSTAHCPSCRVMIQSLNKRKSLQPLPCCLVNLKLSGCCTTLEVRFCLFHSISITLKIRKYILDICEYILHRMEDKNLPFNAVSATFI